MHLHIADEGRVVPTAYQNWVRLNGCSKASEQAPVQWQTRRNCRKDKAKQSGFQCHGLNAQIVQQDMDDETLRMLGRRKIWGSRRRKKQGNAFEAMLGKRARITHQ
eukprot:365451-Chlamydomonas_euryale.AAC.13